MDKLLDLLLDSIKSFKDEKYIKNLLYEIKEEEKSKLSEKVRNEEVDIFSKDFHDRKNKIKEIDNFFYEHYHDDFLWSKPVKILIENKEFKVRNWRDALIKLVSYVLKNYLSYEYYEKSNALSKILSEDKNKFDTYINVDFSNHKFYLKIQENIDDIIVSIKDIYEEFDMNYVEIELKNDRKESFIL